jgi:hypothetical protein
MRVGKEGDRGHGEEMAQTMYAHMNKWINNPPKLISDGTSLPLYLKGTSFTTNLVTSAIFKIYFYLLTEIFENYR